MKPVFIKTVFVVELLVVLFAAIFFGSLFLDDSSKSNLIKEYGVFESRDGKVIYLKNKEESLLFNDVLKEAVNFSTLHLLEKGDTFSFLHKKTKRGEEVINYWFKKIQPVAISCQYGSILSYDAYLTVKKSPFRLIGNSIIVFPLIILGFAIIYSWYLALILYLFTNRYGHLENHMLVQHKIFNPNIP